MRVYFRRLPRAGSAQADPALYIYLSRIAVVPAAPQPALLALADGTIFRGRAIGAEGLSSGEIVFNTAITGYQEILTDPSYCRQIITLTYPHIGNTGTNREDDESPKVFA